MPLDRRHFGHALLAPITGSLLVGSASLLASGCGGRDSAPSVGYTLLDGRSEQLAAQRGKVVLVTFWATSCVVCVREMPELVATWRRFQARGYDTLAVAVQHDPPALVASFAESRALPFGVAIDNTGAVAKAFGSVRATPTHFVIDKRGGIAARGVGAPDFGALHAQIERLLGETA